MIKKIRLSKSEVSVIKSAVLSFDAQAKIFIFGSRTDISKGGGDIDLLVISKSITFSERRKIRVELIQKLGDRKIDLIITREPRSNVFTSLAYKYGVGL